MCVLQRQPAALLVAQVAAGEPTRLEGVTRGTWPSPTPRAAAPRCLGGALAENWNAGVWTRHWDAKASRRSARTSRRLAPRAAMRARLDTGAQLGRQALERQEDALGSPTQGTQSRAPRHRAVPGHQGLQRRREKRTSHRRLDAAPGRQGIVRSAGTPGHRGTPHPDTALGAGASGQRAPGALRPGAQPSAQAPQS